MINIEFDPSKYEIRIEGHAESGNKGEDVVCAAVSILFYTLAQSLHTSKHMLESDIDFSDELGNGYIACKPKEEYEANVALMYFTILNGFELISNEYKDNVTLDVKK